jgi:hypothetical protein
LNEEKELELGDNGGKEEEERKIAKQWYVVRKLV